MTDEFSQDMLLKVVAQICQMVGYHRIMSSSLNVLADILRVFICHIGQTAQHYAEHCGRTCLNLNDLSLAFFEFDIRPPDLLEFLMSDNHLPHSILIPKYPVTKCEVYLPCDKSHDLSKNKCNNEEPKETLKIKISLSKIKAATTSKRNKSMKKKKKNKKKKHSKHQ